MSRLRRVRLATLAYFLGITVPVLFGLPWWLVVRTEGLWVWQGSWPQWVGVWLMADGAALTAWCVNLFNVLGQGTPVPCDPPKRFVATGPYRVVRNPMFLGMFLLVGGEALLYQSPAVGVFLLVLMAAAILFNRFQEEPALARRFGESYLVYRRMVPAWIPRLPGPSAP